MALSIGFVLPFGELSESFFPDTLLAQLCADARRAGHRADLVRVYFDGHDQEVDRSIGARLRAWLAEREVDVIVAERVVDMAPLRAHLAAASHRRVVLVSRGDSFDPIDGVDLVVGADPGVTRSGETRRSPAVGEIALAFERVLEALADGLDPTRVPGVGRVVEGRLIVDAPLERPVRRPPFDAVVEMDVIAAGEPPPITRKTLFGNVGCPYAADPMTTPHFQGVRLPTTRPIARLGCAFCSLGGDYEKRPEAEVVARTLEQATFWAERAPTVRELVLSDQYSLRYLAALMNAARGLRPMRWLFAARSDAFVRELSTVRAAVDAAAAAGHTLEVYLTGFESFSDAELLRYNKGVTVAEQIAAIASMRALARERPEAFAYAAARGHSLILWSPWTTPEELRESVDVLRAEGLSELFHEMGRNRLRLYRDLPIFYAAERDGALLEEWESGDEGVARAKGYNAEHPWRFLDPRTRVAHGVARALRERLGMATELAQLTAAAELAVSAPPDADAEQARARALAGVDALERALAGGARAAATERAAVVRLTGSCNNGCLSCPNRDRHLDSSERAARARIEEARSQGGPVVLAGREPTLHPAFLELVRAAAGSDRRAVAIVSNGRRFASSAFARAAVEAGLTRASVKMFGADASTADAIARDAGAHAQALAGMRNLRAAGVRSLEVRAPLHAQNLATLETLPEVARRAGATHLRVEAALDAVGLANLEAAARAVEALSSACARVGLSLESSPLAAGTSLFDRVAV
ncbi:MAG: radical SAM protein [Deltaproteobacteria bacterium]|nr:radical SAM protein [Deltaproteobacteria bacterium]